MPGYPRASRGEKKGVWLQAAGPNGLVRALGAGIGAKKMPVSPFCDSIPS